MPPADASRPLDHVVGVLLHGALVEGADLGYLGRSFPAGDLLCDPIERRDGPAGEEDLRALAGEGTGDGAADRPSRSIDDCTLALKEHLVPSCRVQLPS
jgi:hypothetical protein